MLFDHPNTPAFAMRVVSALDSAAMRPGLPAGRVTRLSSLLGHSDPNSSSRLVKVLPVVHASIDDLDLFAVRSSRVIPRTYTPLGDFYDLWVRRGKG